MVRCTDGLIRYHLAHIGSCDLRTGLAVGIGYLIILRSVELGPELVVVYLTDGLRFEARDVPCVGSRLNHCSLKDHVKGGIAPRFLEGFALDLPAEVDLNVGKCGDEIVGSFACWVSGGIEW